MTVSMFSAALVASLVGYGSSIAIILSAAQVLGATPAQTASWVLALCLAKAIGSAYLSSRHRMPMVLAWSTPGAALIAASHGLSLDAAVAAFIFAGLLVATTGFIRPLGRAISAIPDGIAGAMLAGVLLPFCLAGLGGLQDAPALILPMVLVFFVVRLWNPSIAVLAALAAGLILSFFEPSRVNTALEFSLPHLVLITPDITFGALIGLGLPLYLVTMASQNLPGFATLRAHGFEPPVESALRTTGGLSAIAGLFGAHAISMAAITAAICMGPDVHPNPKERWRVGLAYAAIWLVLGILSPVILELVARLPATLMAMLVCLALLGPLMGALTSAFAHPEQRFAATATIIVSASGFTAFGIGAAFWGLVAGIAIYAIEQAKNEQAKKKRAG